MHTKFKIGTFKALYKGAIKPHALVQIRSQRGRDQVDKVLVQIRLGSQCVVFLAKHLDGAMVAASPMVQVNICIVGRFYLTEGRFQTNQF